MKKIILIVLILLLGGCYDYNELTDLAIVSSMFIDYKDDEYVVDLEVLDTNEMVVEPSYFIEGRGKKFENALNDIYNKSTKHIYLSHMNAIVLSDEIVEDKMIDLYDYFLRNTDIRKDSYFIISKNTQDLLSFKTEDKTSIGESIKKIIEYNEKENAKFKTSKFSTILNCYLNDKNYLLGEISIEKNMITTSEVYLIHNDKLAQKLDQNAVLLANLLDSTTSSFIITLDNSYEVYRYKLGKKVSKNKIEISVDAEVRFLNVLKEDVNNKKDLESLEQKLNNYLTRYFENSIKYSKNIDYDLYNFNYLYYLYEPDLKENDSWKNLEYDVLVNTTINEKGLLIGTMGDTYEE